MKDETNKVLGSFWAAAVACVVALLLYLVVPGILYTPLKGTGWIEVVSTVLLLALISTVFWALTFPIGFIENSLPSKTWMWVIPIALIMSTYPVDLLVEDGQTLSIVTLVIVVTGFYLMKRLAKVEYWKNFRKTTLSVLTFLVGWLSVGAVYTYYRHTKFAYTYSVKYKEIQGRLGEKAQTDSTAKITLEKELKELGPIPLAENYKAQNLRWWIYWPGSAFQYFFTHMIRDFFNWLYSKLSIVLDWGASEYLKGLPVTKSK